MDNIFKKKVNCRDNKVDNVLRGTRLFDERRRIQSDSKFYEINSQFVSEFLFIWYRWMARETLYNFVFGLVMIRRSVLLQIGENRRSLPINSLLFWFSPL